VVTIIQENQKKISIQERIENDPLIQLFNPKNEKPINMQSIKAMGGGSPSEMVCLKIKTRLFIYDGFESSKPKQQEEIINKFVRCIKCHAILDKELAVSNFDESLVLDQYEPQDAGALTTMYCEILK
jgi:hypothetical protein